MTIGRRALWYLRTRLRATPLRRFWILGRHAGLEAGDVMLACYPRSGSNWLQFMIIQALTGEDPNFQSVRTFSPYLGGQKGAERLLPSGARLIKTHEAYHQIYRRAILLLRDPRDVVLSDYRYLRRRGDYVGRLDQFVNEFIAGRAHGFGSWGDHLQSWLDSGLPASDLFFLRYEDLRRSPAGELARVLAFLRADCSGLNLEEIVSNNSIERMRAKETAEHGSGETEEPVNLYVHRGAVGGWQDELTSEQRGRIEAAFGPLMDRAGYALAGPIDH